MGTQLSTSATHADMDNPLSCTILTRNNRVECLCLRSVYQKPAGSNPAWVTAVAHRTAFTKKKALNLNGTGKKTSAAETDNTRAL